MNVKPSQARQIHAHIRNTQKPRACALAGQPCTSDTRGLLRRGVAYVKKSMYKEAMAEFEKGVSMSPDDPVALTGLGYGYAVMGRRAGAEEVLARLNELSKREFVSPVWMAKIYSGLGEKDKAIESLESAYEDRSIVSVAFIKTNPMLDPLRPDPRFVDLLRRMKLEP